MPQRNCGITCIQVPRGNFTGRVLIASPKATFSLIRHNPIVFQTDLCYQVTTVFYSQFTRKKFCTIWALICFDCLLTTTRCIDVKRSVIKTLLSMPTQHVLMEQEKGVCNLSTHFKTQEGDEGTRPYFSHHNVFNWNYNFSPIKNVCLDALLFFIQNYIKKNANSFIVLR